jgi:diguanylate cyclase (GGDEF)-like protein
MAAEDPLKRQESEPGGFSWAAVRRDLFQSTLVAPYDEDPGDIEFSRRLTTYRLMQLVMLAALVVVIIDSSSVLPDAFSLLASAVASALLVVATSLWVFRRGTFLLPPIIPLLATLGVILWSIASGNAQHYFWLFPLMVALAGLLPTTIAVALGSVVIASLIVMQRADMHPWSVVNDLILVITLVLVIGVMRLVARQSKELADLALTDPLTGAYNRRYLMPQTQRNLADYQRYMRLSSLLLIDIDHFKSINDDYGHATGDRVLQGVVKLISDRIRGVDMLFRLGGEEFVVLLTAVASPSAVKVAEELRKMIKALELLPDRSVTVSIGVCDVSQTGSPTDWLGLVDSAMYRAKQKGRDRVEAIQSSKGAVAGELVNITAWR